MVKVHVRQQIILVVSNLIYGTLSRLCSWPKKIKQPFKRVGELSLNYSREKNENQLNKKLYLEKTRPNYSQLEFWIES